MHTIKNTILLAILVMGIIGCGDTSTSGKVLKTKKGYSYEVYKGDGTKKADTTDFISFQYQFYGDDTLLIEDSRTLPQEPTMQIPVDIETNDKVHPITEISRGLTKGDSIVLRMPIDSIPGAKAQFPTIKEVSYRLNVTKVMSAEEYKEQMVELQKKQMEAMEQSKARIPEVDGIVQDLIKKYKKGKLTPKKMPSGLEIQMIEEGTGAQIMAKEGVTVDYYGVLMSDGTNFDTSFKRGQPFSFNVGRGMVIPGWDEGLQQLKHGDKAFLIIPSDLAYGKNSPSPQIPANSDLGFYIEVK